MRTEPQKFSLAELSIIYARVPREVRVRREGSPALPKRSNRKRGIKEEVGWIFAGEVSEARRQAEAGIEIALRDSQTAWINANNWILPAISVSLERRAAQLRNAPRRRLRRRRWIGSGRTKRGRGRRGRRGGSVHPVWRESLSYLPSNVSLPFDSHPTPSFGLPLPVAELPSALRLRDLFSLFYARPGHMRFLRTPYFLSGHAAHRKREIGKSKYPRRSFGTVFVFLYFRGELIRGLEISWLDAAVSLL